MKLKILDTIYGVDIFGLSVNGFFHSRIDDFQLYESNSEIFPIDYVGLLYRSVSYDKWGYVKENGVDVNPTNSVIYCDDLEEASKYGGWPKVIMGFDRRCLDTSCRIVDSSIEDSELKILLEKFPTKEKTINGSKFWLSRLPLDDSRRGSPYEMRYGRWIPGDPWQALKLIILADLEDRDWIL